MHSETKSILGILVTITFIIALTLFLVMGPKGCSRQFNSWKASSYGSDWLVVQYAQDGSVINHWKLHNKSVGNEDNSDGIYFLDDQNNVVHLSGHYVYIQVNGDFEKLEAEYLRTE